MGAYNKHLSPPPPLPTPTYIFISLKSILQSPDIFLQQHAEEEAYDDTLWLMESRDTHEDGIEGKSNYYGQQNPCSNCKSIAVYTASNKSIPAYTVIHPAIHTKTAKVTKGRG